MVEHDKYDRSHEAYARVRPAQSESSPRRGNFNCRSPHVCDFRIETTCNGRLLDTNRTHLCPKQQVTPGSSVLLYSGETWAVVKQHISPLAVFQMNCLRRICGVSLRDHVPNVDILNRYNILSVESQLQGKRLR